MKKIIIVFLVVVTLFTLSGCFKQEMYSFIEGDYVLVNDENVIPTFYVYKIDNVKLSFKEISKDEYDVKEMKKVLENRYSNTYYDVEFSITIDGIEYNNVDFTEIPGSSAYHDRYFFKMYLTVNEIEYDCTFRFDMHNYSWIYDGNDDQGNYMVCDIFDVVEKDGKRYNGNCLASFSLKYNGN